MCIGFCSIHILWIPVSKCTNVEHHSKKVSSSFEHLSTYFYCNSFHMHASQTLGPSGR